MLITHIGLTFPLGNQIGVPREIGVTLKNIEQFVRIDEVAAHLGTSRSLIRKKTHDLVNPLPHHRIPGGRSVRFRLSEIDAWLSGGSDVTS